MPNRTANGKITLHRDGKRVIVRSGETFNFTAEEIAEIGRVNPSALRKPVVEAPVEVKTQIEQQLEQAAGNLGNLANGKQDNNEGKNETAADANKATAQSGSNRNRNQRAPEPKQADEDTEL